MIIARLFLCTETNDQMKGMLKSIDWKDTYPLVYDFMEVKD